MPRTFLIISTQQAGEPLHGISNWSAAKTVGGRDNFGEVCEIRSTKIRLHTLLPSSPKPVKGRSSSPTGLELETNIRFPLLSYTAWLTSNSYRSISPSPNMQGFAGARVPQWRFPFHAEVGGMKHFQFNLERRAPAIALTHRDAGKKW